MNLTLVFHLQLTEKLQLILTDVDAVGYWLLVVIVWFSQFIVLCHQGPRVTVLKAHCYGYNQVSQERIFGKHSLMCQTRLLMSTHDCYISFVLYHFVKWPSFQSGLLVGANILVSGFWIFPRNFYEFFVFVPPK